MLQTIPMDQIAYSARDDIYLRMHVLLTQDKQSWDAWGRGVSECGLGAVKSYEEFFALGHNIQLNGVKEPIIVQKIENKYYIEDGADRTAIARILGHNVIPANVVNFQQCGTPSVYLMTPRQGIPISHDPSGVRINEVFKYISDTAKQKVAGIVKISLIHELQMALWSYQHNGTFRLKNKIRRFGRGNFYQSLDGIVDGQRHTGERIKAYKLLDILNKDQDVLDMGAACGFMSLAISDHVKSVHCVEGSSELINMGIVANSYFMKDNITFEATNFHDFKTDKKYDVILALALHGWLDWEITFDIFVDRILDLLSKNGYIVFETHSISDDNPEFEVEKKIDMFKKYCDIIHEGYFTEGYIHEQPHRCKDRMRRKYLIFKKR